MTSVVETARKHVTLRTTRRRGGGGFGGPPQDPNIYVGKWKDLCESFRVLRIVTNLCGNVIRYVKKKNLPSQRASRVPFRSRYSRLLLCSAGHENRLLTSELRAPVHVLRTRSCDARAACNPCSSKLRSFFLSPCMHSRVRFVS